MWNTPLTGRFRRSSRRLLAIGCLLGAAGCSGSKEPEPLPSQTVSQVTPQLQPPPPPQLPPIRQIEPTRKSTVKVIDEGGGADKPLTLAEASQIAKAQKSRIDPEPIAQITDENLHEFAEGGDVIVLESAPAAAPLNAEPDPTEAERKDDGVRDEDYWRTRALELRMGWRRTVDRIEELELESAAMRQQFYAEEDTYIRDSQLKPAWDRVLDLLDDLRERSARYQQELEVFVDEGRRAGALQGWLNQGWELEPTTEERERIEQIPAHQSIDPPVLDEDGR